MSFLSSSSQLWRLLPSFLPLSLTITAFPPLTLCATTSPPQILPTFCSIKISSLCYAASPSHEKAAPAARCPFPLHELADAAASTELGSDRISPRVEEKDGYWVLKPNARVGINPTEKKDLVTLLFEGEVKELAQKSMDEIDSSKEGKEDIDSRLKWLRLFHRRKHHYEPHFPF